MNNDIKPVKKQYNGKTFVGILILTIGVICLLNQLNWFFIPSWLFSWPMWLIIPGLYIGAKSNFQKPVWFILVLLGVTFLIKEALEDHFPEIDGILWPLFFIVIGIWIILRRNTKYDSEKWKKTTTEPIPPSGQPAYQPTDTPVVDYVVKDADSDPSPEQEPVNNFAAPQQPYTTGKTYSEDHLNATAIFGGVDKVILSKNFKGGDIVNIFGGTEVDLTKADIHGVVVIDITQVFGGTKLIVPPHWHIVSDTASVFAAVDDKRKIFNTTINHDKVLVIKGFSIFAGVDIRSY